MRVTENLCSHAWHTGRGNFAAVAGIRSNGNVEKELTVRVAQVNLKRGTETSISVRVALEILYALGYRDLRIHRCATMEEVMLITKQYSQWVDDAVKGIDWPIPLSEHLQNITRQAKRQCQLNV